MSSLSHLPHGKTLDYWFEQLRGKRYRWRFMATKVLEILAYGSGKQRKRLRQQPLRFPRAVQNLPPFPARCRVAVVAPARIRNPKEASQLLRLLRALDHQTHPADALILVDDGSSLFPPVAEHRVVLFSNEKAKGPASARNMGIEAALALQADVVLFTDADCEPAPDWIAQITAAFSAHPTCAALSGNTISAGATWLDRYHEINGTLNGRQFRGSDQLLYGPTCNLAVRAEALQNHRFNPAFPQAACEDIEFCCRLLLAGYRIGFAADAIVQHDFGYVRGKSLSNLRTFLRQFRRYGQGEQMLLRLVPRYYGYLRVTGEISDADRDIVPRRLDIHHQREPLKIGVNHVDVDI